MSSSCLRRICDVPALLFMDEGDNERARVSIDVNGPALELLDEDDEIVARLCQAEARM